MSEPRGVSVVIPHYGDPVHAERLARQLLAQPTRRSLQVVVADDCSPQPFPDVPGVEVVRRTENGGFGSAANSGAARADQPLLLLLNSDLLLPDAFLDTFLDAVEPLMPCLAAPTVVTGGRVPGGHRFPRARYQAVEWVSVAGRWQSSAWFRRSIGLTPPPRDGGRSEVDWVSGEAMVLPRAAFEQVGGFDEGFFMYAEEVDLQRRLHDVGVPRVLLDTEPVDHAGEASSDPTRIRGWLTTSRLRYAGKWGGRGRLRAALTAATGVNLLVNATRRALGRDVHPVTTAREELRLIWR